MSFRRSLACLTVAVALAIGPLLAYAQFGLPAVPGVGALPGAAAAVPGASAAPQTLWRFLGFRGGQRWRNLRDALVNRRGNFPGLEKKPRIRSLTDPENMKSDNPAIKEAAATKADADAAPQKVKAIKYLATVGCSSNGCYPNIKSALLAALDDCTEEVRYEAAKAFIQVAGDKCNQCRETCCDKEVTDKLFSVAYDRTDRCCYKEISPRVRKAARRALCACATPGPGGSPPPQPTEGPKEDPDAAPKEAAPKTASRGATQVIRSQFVVPERTAPSNVESVAQDIRESKSGDLTGGIKAFLDPHIRSEGKATANVRRASAAQLAAQQAVPGPAPNAPRSRASTPEPELRPEDEAADPLASTSLAPAAGAVRKTRPENPTASANTFYDRLQPAGDVPPNEVKLAGYEDDDDLDSDMGNQVRRAFAERFGFSNNHGRGNASASNTSPFQRNGAPPSGLATKPAPRSLPFNTPANAQTNAPPTRPTGPRPGSENPAMAARTGQQPPARVMDPIAPPARVETPAGPGAPAGPALEGNPAAPRYGNVDPNRPAPWAQDAGEEAPNPLPFEPPAPAPRRIDPNPPVDQTNPFDTRVATRVPPPIETRPYEARPEMAPAASAPAGESRPAPEATRPAELARANPPEIDPNKRPLWADPLPTESAPGPSPAGTTNPGPVAALSSPPKARLGVAKPLIRYGAVRPLVRYGAVKAADAPEESAEDDEMSEVPDDTGFNFDAASRGKQGTFAHGTDAWRWAQGRLFARGPGAGASRHVHAWEEPTPVEEAPRTADREPYASEGGETTYRR